MAGFRLHADGFLVRDDGFGLHEDCCPCPHDALGALARCHRCDTPDVYSLDASGAKYCSDDSPVAAIVALALDHEGNCLWRSGPGAGESPYAVFENGILYIYIFAGGMYLRVYKAPMGPGGATPHRYCRTLGPIANTQVAGGPGPGEVDCTDPDVDGYDGASTLTPEAAP